MSKKITDSELTDKLVKAFDDALFKSMDATLEMMKQDPIPTREDLEASGEKILRKALLKVLRKYR